MSAPEKQDPFCANVGATESVKGVEKEESMASDEGGNETSEANELARHAVHKSLRETRTPCGDKCIKYVSYKESFIAFVNLLEVATVHSGRIKRSFFYRA